MSMSLKELISHLFVAIDEHKELNSLDEQTQEMLETALDRVIDGTEPIIRLVPSYKRKLYKSILKSLEYAGNLVERIPRAIELNSNHFSADPYIRAFFPTMDGLKKTCHQSSELRDFFAEPEHANQAESCALLCMQKKEETVLGIELSGDQLVKDVRQTRVTFAGHRIYSPADSEANARQELKCCLFEGLVNNALDKISELRMKRYQLETRQQILSSRLRGRDSASNRDSELRHIAKDREYLRDNELQLERVEDQLQAMGYVTPETCLGIVNDILSQPDKYVSLNIVSMKLNKSGIKRSGSDVSESAANLVFSEVRIEGEIPRVVSLAKINRDEVTASSRESSTSKN